MTSPNKLIFSNQDDIRYQTINDLLSLAVGIDLVVSSLKTGEMSKEASDNVREIIMQSYITVASKVAFNVLQEYQQVPLEDTLDQYIISIDTPEENRNYIIIEYKSR